MHSGEMQNGRKTAGMYTKIPVFGGCYHIIHEAPFVLVTKNTPNRACGISYTFQIRRQFFLRDATNIWRRVSLDIVVVAARHVSCSFHPT